MFITDSQKYYIAGPPRSYYLIDDLEEIGQGGAVGFFGDDETPPLAALTFVQQVTWTPFEFREIESEGVQLVPPPPPPPVPVAVDYAGDAGTALVSKRLYEMDVGISLRGSAVVEFKRAIPQRPSRKQKESVTRLQRLRMLDEEWLENYILGI